ncbi:MAG: hypothetical protein OEV40_23265 [Acidimicrobiia bacterium]|nr:hypothetical protein [Acidimicrobiia bacterium]
MTAGFGSLLAAFRRRAVELAQPEVAVGITIVVGWAALALGPVVPAPVVLAVAAGVAALHLAAVDTGSFTLLWLATGTVLTFVVVAAQTSLSGVDPVVLTVAGFCALAHNETIRLGHARRRLAAVDRVIFTGSVIGVGLAGLVSLIAIGIAGPIADDPGGRSWLWMPLAVAVLVGLLVGFTIGPTWRAPDAARERWQPGDRLPPHHHDQPSTN